MRLTRTHQARITKEAAMRVSRIVAVVAAAVAGILGIAHIARAQGPGGGHGWFMQARIDAHIDDALDAIKATPEQRRAINAAKDHLIDVFHEQHQSHPFKQAAAILSADKLDQAKIAELRAAHEANAKKIGDAVVQTFYDLHDALTATQRQALITYVRNELPAAKTGGWREKFMRNLVDNRLDDALAKINANAEQRNKIHAVKERVIAAIHDMHKDRQAHINEILDIFAAPKIDASRVQALRTQHEAQAKRIGDVVVGAVTEVHGTLTPVQRKAALDLARAHHAAHSE
jgi:Spy/CpxP family protein refolding chaperone